MSKNALPSDQERYSVYVGAKVVICFEMCKGWVDFFMCDPDGVGGEGRFFVRR